MKESLRELALAAELDIYSKLWVHAQLCQVFPGIPSQGHHSWGLMGSLGKQHPASDLAPAA